MEKILPYLFDGVVLLEFLAALASTIFFTRYNRSRSRNIIFYLWLIFLTELVGTWMLYNGYSNVTLYNLSKWIQYSFLLYLFYKHIDHVLFRKIAGIFILIFWIAYGVNAYLYEGLSIRQPNYAFTIGSVLIALSILLFFYSISQTDIILKIKDYLIVWIGFGLLVFHISILPLNVLANSLREIAPNSNSILIIKFVLNVVMYVTFIKAFVSCKKNYTF